MLLGSSARLVVVVEDRLDDLDVFLLAEIVGGLVLRMVLLHPGQALTGGQTGLLLVLEALQLLQVAFVLVLGLSLGFVLGLLRVVLPNLFENGNRVNDRFLGKYFFVGTIVVDQSDIRRTNL